MPSPGQTVAGMASAASASLARRTCAPAVLASARPRLARQVPLLQPLLPTSSQRHATRHHRQHRAYSSHSPMAAATGSSAAAPPRKPVTLATLRALYRRKEPIAVMTAHDFPSGHVADAAGMDMILVGDSLAMVALGMEDTSEVLVEEMLLHCRSVARAAPHGAFLVGDLPMGSYEVSSEQALETAIRFVKEGRVQAVKLEGGGPDAAAAIRKITGAGIPVLGHIGLTPQRQNALGGFRVQGKTAGHALGVLEDALAVQAAGAFAVVIEAVPAEVAAIVTQKLAVPTIGIGAGNGCSGQVLVQVDMTGNFPPGRRLPKFVKQYGDVWSVALRALQAYRADVKSRAYPAAEEHTYPIPADELALFANAVEHMDEHAVEHAHKKRVS